MTNPPLHIVLVDDEEDDRHLIRWALTSTLPSVTLQELTTGQQLLDWLDQQPRLADDQVIEQAQKVTIIVLDMHMPTLTGLETLHYLGDMHHLAYMPVIMLTASLSDQLKQQAYQLEIHLFMLKPAGTNGYYRVVEAVKLCYRDVLRIREQQRLANDFR